MSSNIVDYAKGMLNLDREKRVLTNNQRKILECLSQDLSMRAIAGLYNLSVSQVRAIYNEAVEKTHEVSNEQR